MAAPNPGPYCAVPAPAELAALRDLQRAAARNHRSLPPSHPARRAAAELAALLRDLLDRGCPAAALGAALDPPLTHQAVRQRAAAAPAPALTAPPATAPALTAPAPRRASASATATFPPPPGTSLIADAPYRRVRLLQPPYPLPPTRALPLFRTADTGAERAFIRWLASDRAPGAALVDDALIRLLLAPAPTRTNPTPTPTPTRSTP